CCVLGLPGGKKFERRRIDRTHRGRRRARRFNCGWLLHGARLYFNRTKRILGQTTLFVSTWLGLPCTADTISLGDWGDGDARCKPGRTKRRIGTISLRRNNSLVYAGFSFRGQAASVRSASGSMLRSWVILARPAFLF